MNESLELPTELFEKLEQKSFVSVPSNSPTTFWYRLRKAPMAMTAMVLLGFILFFTICGPMLTGYSYAGANLPMKNRAPSTEHWFGTDGLGRDVFTRVCLGGRISLFIGSAAAFMDLIFGVGWGAFSSFIGGRVDRVLMRISDILFTLPQLLVVMILSISLGNGLLPVILSIAFMGWIPMARIVRGEIQSIKQQDYVQAAISIGASTNRILSKHIIPNAIGPIIVAVTMTIPKAIFIEAFLSFLGLGVQAPMASWGTMAKEALPSLQYYPWRLFFPALFMSLTILSFNLIGDSLRYAWDIRVRG